MRGIFGRSSPDCFAYFDHDSCCWRTSQGTLVSGLDEFSETWPDSGTMRSGRVYELQGLERPTCESGSSSWPTASASVANDGESLKSWERRREKNLALHLNGNGMGTPLTIAAVRWPTARMEDGESAGNHPGATDSLTGATKNWPTPRAGDIQDKMGSQGEFVNGRVVRKSGQDFAPSLLTMAERLWQTPATDSFRSRGGDRKAEMGLDQQARFFPTPAERDYRTPNLKADQHADQLQNFVAHSLPAPLIPDGQPSSPPGPTSLRRLNPRFVEWLMGFPVKWTEL